MRSRPVLAALLVFSAVFAGSCGGIVGPSQNTLEEFSGFVDPLGEGPQHEFSASRNAEFEIRFLGFDPTNAILQVVFGQFVGGACQQPIGTSFGGQNTIVLTGAISSGRYCILVFDEGLIAQRVTYTVRVSHP
jgi:hypothetical protein